METKTEPKLGVWKIISIILFVLLITVSGFLSGLLIGYFSDDTKHEFTFDIGADTQELISALENHTKYENKNSNKTCLQGCIYAFETIANELNVVSINGFWINDCNIYCNNVSIKENKFPIDVTTLPNNIEKYR